MLPRSLELVIDKVITTFPAVVITGPRQSGKTTLLKAKFAASHRYLNLEDPNTRRLAQTDPQSFLFSSPAPAIIDEIQYAPELLSYIKTSIEDDHQPGRWLLTGSQNFTLMQGISQSLAGRAAILSLLPLSLSERLGHGYFNSSVSTFLSAPFPPSVPTPPNPPDLAEIILRGQYPQIAADSKVDRSAWCGSYIATYLERDIRNLKQVGDLGLYEQFLRACAIRTGQILDLSTVARDVGISFATAKRWLSLLETGYQILLLYPYYRNLGKRMVKRPKLYFTDTGLASYLMGIHNRDTLFGSPTFGQLFETLIVTDFWKRFVHHLEPATMYYLRTRDGLEIDLLIDQAGQFDLIEIKSTSTLQPELFASLHRTTHDLKSLVHRQILISNSPKPSTYKSISCYSWQSLFS